MFTIIVVLLMLAIIALIGYISIKYFVKILKEVINICCYVETHHWDKDLWQRMEIGQKKLYKSLFQNKDSEKMRERTNYIFWGFYTKVFSPLLDVIPAKVLQYNNKVVREGEVIDREKFINEYNESQQKLYDKYVCHCKDCKCPKEENETASEVVVEFKYDEKD